MLCPKCGYYTEQDESVCPSCGSVLNHESGIRLQGAQAIRQGKRARETAVSRPAQKGKEPDEKRRRSGASHATVSIPSVKDKRTISDLDGITVSETEGFGKPGASFERRRRTVYDETADPEQAARYMASRSSGKNINRRMINWVKIGMLITVGVILLIGGIVAYLKFTTSGQLMTTRLALQFPWMNIEVSASSLWTIGEELMDEGQIHEAIECFERAKKINESEGTFNVDGMLTLGSAYEADGRTDDAALLYEKIYTEAPSRPEAYKAHIRILENSKKKGDLIIAGELMKKAYEQTKENVFLTQRNDFLPAMPEVDLTA